MRCWTCRRKRCSPPAREFADDPELHDLFTGILQQGGFLSDIEYPLRRRSGEVRWAILSAFAVGYANERAVIMGFQDITERKRSEVALRQSEENFRQLVQSAPVPMIVTRIEDGVIARTNQAFCDLLGMPSEQLVGRPAADFQTAPLNRAALLRTIEQHGIAQGLELELIAGTGRGSGIGPRQW